MAKKKIKKKPAKKKTTRKPTIKQSTAINLLIGKRGKRQATSITDAMRRAGYSEATINSPGNLTKSKTFKELMEVYLPDDLLARTHNELIGSRVLQKVTFRTKLKSDKLNDEDLIEVVESIPGCTALYIQPSADGYGRTVHFSSPEGRIRKEALDMAYKLKGEYAAEKVEIQDPLSSLSNKELAVKIAKLKGVLIKKKK